MTGIVALVSHSFPAPVTEVLLIRYYASKLLEILCVRQLAEEIASTSPKVVVNALTPGYCVTGLVKEVQGFWGWQLYIMKLSLARTAEEGSRTLVHAASLGLEGHGKYLNDCQIDESVLHSAPRRCHVLTSSSVSGALSDFVRSAEGSQAQRKVWNELLEKLECIAPGISGTIG